MSAEILDVAGLVAEFPQFFKSEASIYTRRTRNPRSMPPPLAIPGSSRLVWNRAAVIAWFTPHESDSARKKGRPTKSEQIARARAEVARDPRTVDFIACKTDEEAGGAK